MDEDSDLETDLEANTSNQLAYNNKSPNSLKTEYFTEQNLNDTAYGDDEPCSAPVEILSEFLSTLMARNYKSAFYYCKLILLYEPDNETVQEFYPLIQEKMHLDNYDSEDQDESSSSRSESSTEYFSSTSVGTDHMSSFLTSSSDEDEISSS